MNQSENQAPKKYKRYKNTELHRVFNINTIYTVHYFEYDCNYVFKGEQHDFWEILFVDSGTVEVTAGDRKVILDKGNIIFHEPNEFHDIRATGKNAPNLIVISFDCDSPHMERFRQRVMTVSENELHLFANLMEIARNTFSQPMRNPLRCRYDAPFGNEQMFLSYLELLLIALYRQTEHAQDVPYTKASVGNGNHIRLMEQVIDYLQERITQNLTVAVICQDNMISKSLLQRIFHEEKGCGVIEYFNRMKIDTAKKLIRENRYTYSEIADILNYSSYQYFSLQFKKYARMSPTEYHSSTQYFH